MRLIPIVLISALLLQTAAAATPDAHQQALALHGGSDIKVRMLSGTVLQGSLGAVSADHFTLILKTSPARAQDLAFSDVRSIRRAGMRSSTKVILIIGAAVVGTALIIGIGIAKSIGWKL